MFSRSNAGEPGNCGFDINDKEARVVGICKSRMAFSGNPYLDRCVIIVTHDNRIFKFVDRMTHMEDGRIDHTDTSHFIKQQHN